MNESCIVFKYHTTQTLIFLNYLMQVSLPIVYVAASEMEAKKKQFNVNIWKRTHVFRMQSIYHAANESNQYITVCAGAIYVELIATVVESGIYRRKNMSRFEFYILGRERIMSCSPSGSHLHILLLFMCGRNSCNCRALTLNVLCRDLGRISIELQTFVSLFCSNCGTLL